MNRFWSQARGCCLSKQALTPSAGAHLSPQTQRFALCGALVPHPCPFPGRARCVLAAEPLQPRCIPGQARGPLSAGRAGPFRPVPFRSVPQRKGGRVTDTDTRQKSPDQWTRCLRHMMLICCSGWRRKGHPLSLLWFPARSGCLRRLTGVFPHSRTFGFLLDRKRLLLQEPLHLSW